MIDELEIELQETTDELEVEDITVGDYTPLTNKPKINNVELVGNKTSSDLGLVDEATLDDYVQKESGKGLSQNDFTNTLKSKLDGISEGAEVNVQSDWNETDSTKDDYIKNKPTIPSLNNYYTKTETNDLLDDKVDKVSGKQLSTNDYTNEDKLKVQSAIDKMVNDLVNYYTKSQTYNKTEVDTLISAIKQFTYEVVDVLPTASASTMNKIYLVPSTTSEVANVKDEYITIQSGSNYSWEKIGATSIDLSNYYTKTQTDNLLSGKVDTSTLENYSTTSQMNTAIEGHHDSTKQDVISDLSTIRSGASLGATALQSVPNTYRTSADQDVIDNTKENVSNKTNVLNDQSTTTQYPSAYATHNAIEDVREVALGKTASYVVSDVTNPSFNTQDDTITLTSAFTDINGVSHGLGELKLGDNIYVQETDVPDRWCSNSSIILPNEYQQLDYIQTDGNQCIDTNIIYYREYEFTNIPFKAIFNVSFPSFESGERVLLAENGEGILLGLNGSSAYTWGYGGTGWNPVSNLEANKLYKFEYGWTSYNSNSFKLDNNDTLLHTPHYTPSNTTKKMLLFSRKSAKQDRTIKCKLYGCEIWYLNECVRRYVPCYRKSDSETGLYDLISNTFFTNLGTSPFINGTVSANSVILHKLETAKVPVNDVQINGTTIVNNSIANIPLASTSVNGVMSASDKSKLDTLSSRYIKTTMDSIANVDTQYYLGEQSSVSFTLPSATAGQSISVVFYSGATATTLSISGTMLGTIPTPVANTRYELNILYDGTNWALLSNAMGTE